MRVTDNTEEKPNRKSNEQINDKSSEKAMIPLLLALYLPQFHQIPENDVWWGAEFTDWHNVRKARPLFPGHDQPRIPLNQEYYDLSDVRVMHQQSLLAQEYGIDGFCFYHYWFEGKKLLEKPVENYRDHQEITLPYCLCWANHSWVNSWGTPQLEDEVLIKQTYGQESSWKEHFEYLLGFFRDNKYLKIHNKPVILLYMAAGIPRVEQMLHFWRAWAVEEGFDGVFVIQMDNSAICCYDNRTELFDATADFEPLRSWSSKEEKKAGTLRIRDIDLIYQDILSRTYTKADRSYYGAFVGWDNTSRKGKHGIVVSGSTPGKFQAFLSQLLEKSHAAENELIFLNAWNEWAEGAYLEPDASNGFEYLAAVRAAKEAFAEQRVKTEFYEKGKQDTSRVLLKSSAFDNAAKWLANELEGRRISDYFIAAGYRSVAIYGAGKLGLLLLKALTDRSIDVVCMIDSKADSLDIGKKVGLIKLDAVTRMPATDVIVVTVAQQFEEIYEEIKATGIQAEIISLGAVIHSY